LLICNSIGLHKLIVLNPPALAYVHYEDIQELTRAEDAVLYIRISHPQGDYINAVPVTISNQVWLSDYSRMHILYLSVSMIFLCMKMNKK